MARLDVIMPQMGESIAEGTLSRWMKKVGEPVKRDEPIFEISTDKVDAEIPAPSAGVLVEIKVQEGQTVPVQTVVAVIDTEALSATLLTLNDPLHTKLEQTGAVRSEERRVGKECDLACRSRWSPYH